jgi:hypothetical protein
MLREMLYPSHVRALGLGPLADAEYSRLAAMEDTWRVRMVLHDSLPSGPLDVLDYIASSQRQALSTAAVRVLRERGERYVTVDMIMGRA